MLRTYLLFPIFHRFIGIIRVLVFIINISAISIGFKINYIRKLNVYRFITFPDQNMFGINYFILGSRKCFIEFFNINWLIQKSESFYFKCVRHKLNMTCKKNNYSIIFFLTKLKCSFHTAYSGHFNIEKKYIVISRNFKKLISRISAHYFVFIASILQF